MYLLGCACLGPIWDQALQKMEYKLGKSSKLTVSRVKQLTRIGEEQKLYDADVRGLYLRVRGPDKASYYVRYKDNAGKWKDRVLENVTILSLDQAREKAREARLTKGKSFEITQTPTFDTFWVDYCRRTRGGKAEATLERRDSLYRVYLKGENEDGQIIKARIGNMLLSEIQWVELDDLLLEVIDVGKKPTALQLRALLIDVFKYAKKAGHISLDPTESLETIRRAEPKSRYLSEKEYRYLFKILSGEFDLKADKDTIFVVLLLCLTGCRMQEVQEADWSEFDFSSKVWIIPKSRNKSSRDYHIPLTTTVLKLLKSKGIKKSGKIFEVGGNAASQFLFRVSTRNKKTCDFFDAPVRSHVLRHSLVTHLAAKFKVLDELKGRVINHAPDKSTALHHYDHHDYLPEKREILQMWDDNLCEWGLKSI